MTARARHRTPPPALAGAVVVVTRPSASAGPLKRRILALGGVVLALPGLSVRAIDDARSARAALRELAADWVVFVSPNAVRHAYALMPRLRFARATRIGAIGAGGAAALGRRGVRDVLWPRQRQDSEGLLALPEFSALRGRRCALIDAPGGRDLLPVELRARGARVQRIHVYQRGAARLDRRHRDALASAGAPLVVQLSSLEALANLRRQLPEPLFARLVAGDAVVSSERLASAAHAAGWQRIQRAASAGVADMIEATSAALARHRL
ncbi:MAG: uroporphyrinogen-III synthase [Rudaea sp.]